MKLASTSDVLSRLKISSDLSGNVSAAESGLEASTILISNLLETDMNSAIVSDFYTPASAMVGSDVNLYLSRMFVNKEEVVKLSYGVYTGDVDADSTTYTVIDPKYYSVDYASGLIKLDSVPTYGKMSIRVDYSSGFSGETDSKIPDWLKQAAITATTYVMHTQVAAHGKKDILDISPEYRRMTYSMIQQHIRSRLNCLFVETTVVES